MADLSVDLCGVKLRNPTILASGIDGVTGASLVQAAKNGAGAVTFKSVSLEPRKGHNTPVMAEFDGGLINAVGLSNSGAVASVEELVCAKQSGVPVIASVFAGSVDEFASVAKILSEAKPDLMEVNISCPNVHSEFGTPFAADVVAAADVTKAVKKVVSCPVLVKLSPNVLNIKPIAKAVKEAGADGLTVINTVSGMLIDAHARRPILTNKFGGVSGPAIKPVALKCVYECYAETKMPIVGTGGVTNGLDAAEMIMAGACAVGMGSALWYRGPKAFELVAGELDKFMDAEGFNSIKEMVGLAHQA